MSNTAITRTGGFTFRGAWSSITSYRLADVVLRDSSSYAALQPSLNVDPYVDYTSGGATNWSLMAEGIFFRGVYSSGTTYYLGDSVTYNSSTYLSVANTNLNHQPDVSPSFWTLMAAQGQVAPRQTVVYTNPSASVSTIQVASNVVTVTTSTPHGFSSSTGTGLVNTVYMTGLTTATFLNAQVLTILSTPTSTTFTAAFTNANYGPTGDTGTANISIPINAQYFTTIALGKTFAMSKVQCAQATRIELYSTNAARLADSSRNPTTQPAVGTQHGVITDLYLDGIVAAFTSWVMSPLSYGANLQDSTVNVPATLTNISGAPTTNTFSITFTFTYEEQ